MKKLRLYLDTTVWNFAFVDDSPEHRKETLEFFQKARLGLFELFYSDAVEREVIAAPLSRRRQIENLLAELTPRRLAFQPEIDKLAKEYLRRSVLPKNSVFDAFHVAYATVYEMDALVSWNFRHLANVNRRNRVVVLNNEKGYNFPIQLVTPLEVLDDEGD
jgi:predicted nucleic acid-binding protein